MTDQPDDDFAYVGVKDGSVRKSTDPAEGQECPPDAPEDRPEYTTEEELRGRLTFIYGLLWLAQVDTTTVTGTAVSLARRAALDMIDKDAQARGIETAKHVVRMKILRAATQEPTINPRVG